MSNETIENDIPSSQNDAPGIESESLAEVIGIIKDNEDTTGNNHAISIPTNNEVVIDIFKDCHNLCNVETQDSSANNEIVRFLSRFWHMLNRGRSRGHRPRNLYQIYVPPGYFKDGKHEHLFTPHVQHQQVFYSGKSSGSTDDIFEYDPETRNDFVRFVMALTLIMLIVTAVVVTAVLAVESLKEMAKRYLLFILIASFTCYIISCTAFTCSQCTKNPPQNYMMLTLTTIGMTGISITATIYMDTLMILYAVICTAAVVMLCFALAFSSFDFTKYILFVMAIGMAVFVASILMTVARFVFGFYMKPVSIALTLLVVVSLAAFLVIEIQMILGGKSLELGEDEYAYAAYLLYTSIMTIFLQFLRLTNELSN